MTSKNPMWRQRCGACDAVVAGAVVIDGDEDALEIAARFLAALGLTADNLRPLPPPIKVGQTVKRCASRDDHLSYEVVAITDGKRVHLWNEETTTPAWDWVHGVRRVDSSPSPEPEHDPDPAPSPSPEVGEGAEPHESEDPEELAAAVAAGLTVDFWGVLSKRWMRSGVELSAEGYRRRIGKGERFQIHGTVPGYGETGGAS